MNSVSSSAGNINSNAGASSAAMWDLLDVLRGLGIRLRCADGKLFIDAPPGALNDELRQRLRAHKEAIIAHMTQAAGAQQERAAGAEPIAVRAPALATRAPLSFFQEGLWFIDQLEQGSAVYNMPFALRLYGQLCERTLAAAVNAIVQRHEVLRTTFGAEGGMAQQHIAPSLAIALATIDLTAVPLAAREAEARSLVDQDVHTAFDLGTGPLLRSSLIRLSATEHLFLVNFHHIVSDGWSLDVFIGELAALYRAGIEGQPSPLPDLALQYADFAAWQRQYAGAGVLAQQLAYWKDTLAGAPALLALPTDRARPAQLSHRGAVASFTIPAATVSALRTLNKDAQSTMFMALAAAFNVLLARYSGQNDICIGTPIANRARAEVEPLIGYFVNTLVLRNALDDSASFLDLLAQVRSCALGAYAHPDLPFDQLVEALNPERHGSYSPLFQVMLTLQNGEAGALELPGLTATPMALTGSTSKFDLSLNVREQGEVLQAGFEYNTDLFDAATMDAMARHFTHLLAAAATAPHTALCELPLMADAERAQLLGAWSGTASAYARASTIHAQFGEQAARLGAASAVEFEGVAVSYAELDARASQLAHHLRGMGVGPDVLVGICAERSVELIVGLLGILKAGGAYLPLDPSYPAERLAYMLDDAAPAVLLTQHALAGTLPSAGIPVLCLDSGWDSSWPAFDGAAIGHPDNLAYVIYTSGSTGKPKGTAVSHRNVLRLVQNSNYFQLAPAGRVLQFAPVAFDASTFEIWASLLNAGCLVLAAPGRHTLEQLGATIVGQRIDTLWLTAALFNQMVEHQLPSLAAARHILAGGEALSRAHVQQLLAAAPDTLLTNGYGPTESTTFTCCHPVRSLAPDAPAVPIGRPIANTRVYILDAQLNPVPAGVAGELHIAGDGLARGYLKRPDQTAEKFIPNPFAGEAGGRMYKSGDLARFLADGSIEFLGRIDAQVKIRGFRIEPGEIEAVLLAQPEVSEAVVLVREDVAGDKRLVAYVVAAADPASLRAALLRSLPEYMVPAHFVVLEQMPLTTNGKLDRRALPAPELAGSELGYVAPRTASEQLLAEVWADLLKCEQVGVHDNFFSLGGHSLLAIQMLSKLRAEVQAELSLRSVFEEPTIAQLALVLDAALPQDHSVRVPGIAPAARGAVLPPLSFAQQRLWFIDQFEPGTGSYNVPLALRLRGTLDQAALQASLDAIVQRHEALRTTFVKVDGVPRQQIAPSLALPLAVTDLAALPPAQAEEQGMALVVLEAQAPFDLAAGPLLRASLIRLSAGEYLLVLNFHHIVADGWSLDVFGRELGALYAAQLAGREAALPALAVQYADFAHWQRQWLSGDVLEQQLSWWTAQLAGAPSLLALPTDRARPPVQTHRGAVLEFALPSTTVASLRTLNLGAQTTMFMTLAAAFKVLLARYSGQTDICVGTPVANRNRAEVEPLIGFFVNTLVLRTELDLKASFLDLLAQVRRTALGAYANQDVPFEQLIEAVNPERQSSYSPLFQVMFSLQNEPGAGLALPGLTVDTIGLEQTSAKFDLTLTVSDAGPQMQAFFEYNTDLFDAATMERMARHFGTLLAGLASAPGQAVGEVPLLAPEERGQLLVQWNDTASAYPAQQTMDALFEHQAARAPHAVAVVFEDTQLTYGELDARANRLAHHLRQLGVGPDVLVGICAERSLDMIVGLMAILKAGGAYVPLDPSYPADRLAYMLEDAAPAVLLTQQHLRASLPAIAGATFCIDSEWPTLAAYGDSKPPVSTLPDNLAYVIYTSGSTGKPKGAMLRHRGLCNLVGAQIIAAQITPGQRMLQFASFNFDASTWEIFITLGSGATLCMAPRDAVMPGNLEGTLLRLEINAALLPPVVLTTLTHVALPHLNTIVSGGEACPASLADAWAAKAKFFNAYGPTEATVYATVAHCEAGLTTVAPIGKPIANTQVYILDEALNPVPPGVAGELHIAGDGLARGYLKRPDLTAAMFVPNPFSDVPGARMYKSGDLARYLPDGNIEYLGRADTQVKIRGFRIEPGEIEAALAAVQGMREALVLAREDVPGDKRLAAYLIWEAGAEQLDTAALRAALLASLPDYMVPSYFIVLEQFPLTPNGKVDRRALPAPDTNRSEAGYVAPRTPVEEILAGIWARLLKRGQVGVHDNFFALGGHSLLATQVMSALREAFAVDLPLRVLFDAPTIGQMAEAVDAARLAGQGAISAITATARGDAMPPLSFAQQRLWFVDQYQQGTSIYNIPLALRLSGELNESALRDALAEIVRRHEALRTTFVKTDGVPLQRIAGALAVPLAVTDLSHLDAAQRGAAAQAVMQREAGAPFDLAAGPLMRASLVRVSDTEHLFLVTFHHIVADGWSMAVFLQELAALYGAFAQGRPSPLAELAIQYADFALWQRQWAEGGALEQQLGYWKSKLGGAPELLALPTDRARPPVRRHRGAVFDFAIPAATVDALRALNQQAQTTMFMTLAAAFKLLLARYSGQHDICIGTPIANRNRAEAEPLIGFFVNTLVLRTEIDTDASFLALLAQVRAGALDAYAHQDVPFEQLIEALNPERQASYSPLFQVLFSLQNAPVGELALPGLALETLAPEHSTAKFDLSLSVNDENGLLLAGFEYDTDLFDASTIARMARHYTLLLAAACEAPHMAVGQLPLLGAEEREQLLVGWNDTASSYPDQATVHALFGQLAARAADATALECEGVHLSYAELDARAGQLARHLRSLGVGPDVLVGICAERSAELIVGLLAILKAGGAYLPLDPAYPAERLSYMLEDAAPAVLLTQQALLGVLPAAGIPALCLDTEWDDAWPLDDGVHAGHPDNLAYVIYTSGSTGKPKGTAVSHRNVLRLVKNSNYFQLDETSRVLQFAPVAFDASTFEIWATLLNGACLVLAAPGRHSLEQLGAAIVDKRIGTLWLTAALFNQMVEHQLPSLMSARHILAGGEALSRTHVQQFLDAGGPTLLSNGYGPTESTTFTCCHVVSELSADAQPVPIGQPIANTQVYILDAHLNPVPAGVAGELHIAGAGLARGYLNRPDQTADKFIPNPFATNGGERMYKSGDLARYLPDGTVEYLGRIDSQVKIRGFRIEPGEIEVALAALAGVREVLVLAREDVIGDKRLVAYMVWEQDSPVLDTDALRSALLHSLPDYMVPGCFIAIDAFPLTANGKVDRRALPAPDTSAGGGYVAPRTPTEDTLAGIWCELLKREQIGVHDNFFAAGGHSLLATQLLSKVRAAFGAELPLRTVFEEATIARLGRALDTARGEQLEQRIPPISPVARGAVPPPLSFSQQRLWFVDQFEPGQAAYNMPLALCLKGQLNEAALRAAVAAIVARHEALRTTFARVDGVPVQVIAPALDLPLPLTDLSGMAHDVRESAALALVQADANLPFDLAAGPLVRAGLVRVKDSEHLFLFTFHHIVSDGWSIGVFMQELAALYQACSEGRASPLAPLAVQYADFAHWQRRWLSGAVLDGQLAYWKQRLAGAPALLSLPTDRPRPAVQSQRGALIEFAVPAVIVNSLHALNKDAQTTMFMTLASAFSVLLSRYSGQDDICIGTPIANRNRAEVEPLIGFFVNTLVLRTQIDAHASFLDLLAQVRSAALGAYAHQDVPFEQLIEAVNPERQSSHSPLFQVMFSLQNEPGKHLALAGLDVEMIGSEHATSKFDLSLGMSIEAGRLVAAFEYNTDLFDGATISRMARHFNALLAALAAAPDAPVGEAQMLAPEERAQLLVQWNDTQAAYPGAQTMHAQFELQVARDPQAVAVEFEDTQLTYGELDARANRLSHHLRQLGVGPDVLVGICVERSLEMIVGLMAILKSGGAYVPLDPSYPPERLAYMLEDSAPAVLLTQQHLLAGLPPVAGATFCIDSEWDQLAAYGTHAAPSAALPDNLAYVIYTSGSTGKPKGAMLRHRGLCNLVGAQIIASSITPGQRMLQFASFNFDASTWEIFITLGSGATLCMAERDAIMPGNLERTLQHLAINVALLPPVVLTTLTHVPLPALNTIVSGGEACPAALADAWAAKAKFFNAYGPTEATVYATVAHCEAGLTSVAPIGKPIANTQVYILDASGNPVPTGVAGELHIAGDGLARGYLNRPDLTAAMFVPNPFSAEPGARMYKSGDLARYLPDGNIEYLGRADTQVKIRGFRIELGEIEAALAAVAGVREALVLAREDNPGDKRLAAYLIWEADAQPQDSAQLRAALLASLPDYMVPAYFIAIEQFPMTPNGKVDRRALPAPDSVRSEIGYVAPRTPDEEVMAAIWADLLKLDRVGVHDNFFALGGHSLLAVSLVEQMRAAGLQVEIKVLFGTPTIAALAASMGTRREVVIPPNGIMDGCTDIVPAMLPLVQLNEGEIARICAQVAGGAANIQDIYPMAPLQEGILFHHLKDPGAASYVTPLLLGFDSRQRLDSFSAALQLAVDRHDILRTLVLWDGLPEPVQVVVREAKLAIDEAAPGVRAIDLAQAPLMRLAASEEAPGGRWLLQILAHHLILDHTTLDILLAEVRTIMENGADSLPKALPFRNFVGQTRLGMSAHEHEAFFSAMLGDVDEPTTPYGLQDSQPHGAGSDRARTLLPADLSAQLRQQARRMGVSVASVMHLAYAQVLARLSGRDDVVFGSVLFGRMDSGAGSDRVLGMFINTLPVRIATGAQTVGQGVRAAHAALAGLLEHEHASLALAQRCSGVHAPQPLFTALLNFRHSQAHGDDAGDEGMAAWSGVELIAGEESSDYPFALSVDDLGTDFMLSAQVDGRLSAASLCGHMQQVLAQLAQALGEAPETAVGSLDPLGAQERQRMLVEWNDTATAYPDRETIHALFEQQAARNPMAIALLFKDEALTYGELNARANQLAHHLRSLGAGPDVMVGICVDRSVEMVVGLLGILKSGAAYLPLDPNYPAERMAFMLEDAAPVVLLTQQHLAARLPAGSATVCLDSERALLDTQPAHDLAPLAGPHNLAYIIYTSGSTGRPKGVAVAHQAVSRLVFDTAYVDLRASDVVAQAASNAFDATTFEVWGALLHGCTLCLVEPQLVMSPSDFGAEIARRKISVLFITTALFNQFALHAPTAFAGMRYVLFGGEAVTTSLVEVILDQGAPEHLVHVYGPTESTTFALSHFVDKSARSLKGLAIGKPIGGTQAYVLDAAGNLVPPGVAGELHIGGDGLARGYLKRPDMTAEKFVPNPFGAPGSRMYRTGDLVRFLDNGDIDYLGRIDTQVKIRGFRIELGEIESTLASVAGVREALVMAREDVAGDKRLAAYLVWEEGAQQQDAAALRASLLETLPAYMVPACFMAMDAFPITPNGKIDRRALPAPEMARSEAGYVAPQSETEETLAAIWAETLGCERIGRHDNFFELGGYSLLAIKLLARVNNAFDISLGLDKVFLHPTVAEFEECVIDAQLAQFDDGDLDELMALT